MTRLRVMTHLDARITISHASPITLDSFAFALWNWIRLDARACGGARRRVRWKCPVALIHLSSWTQALWLCLDYVLD